MDTAVEFSNNCETNNSPRSIESIDKVPKELDEVEIERMVNEIAIAEIESEGNSNDGTNFDANDRDPLFEDAARLIVQSQMGSTSLIQRRMKLGYNRAGRLMDQLESARVIGPNRGSAAREVLFDTLENLEEYLIALEKGMPYQLHDGNTSLAQFVENHKVRIANRVLELRNAKENELTRIEKERIKQKLIEKDRIKNLHKDALKELIAEGRIFNQFINREGKREPIPQDVMDAVWNRDGGQCVKCGGQENLEFDHIIPFSKGGATTYRNMQLLCKSCNIEKSNKIG